MASWLLSAPRTPAVVLFLASWAGAAGPQTPGPCDGLPPTELQRICEAGRIVVARSERERPPFFFTNSQGEWTGFEVDLVEDLASRLGVRHEIKATGTFDEVVDLIQQGEADLGLSKLSITLDRARRVRFTQPYLTVYQTLLLNRLAVARDEDPFVALNRPSARLGVVRGSAYVEYAAETFAQAEVVTYNAFERMMFAVAGHRLDGVFVDSTLANSWRRNNPHRLIQVRAVVDRDRKDRLGVAVHWDNEHLLSWLDLYFDRIRADGWAEQLYERWFTNQEEAPARD